MIDTKPITEITPSRFNTQMENIGYGIGFTKHRLYENHVLRQNPYTVTKVFSKLKDYGTSEVGLQEEILDWLQY